MTSQVPIKENPNKYDLEERTTKFAESIIVFCKKISQNAITNSLINQLIATTLPETKKEARILWQEAKELNLIFNAIIKSSNNKH